MEINCVQSKDLSFGAIKTIKRTGEWAKHKKTMQRAEKAFRESEVFAQYCKSNDVDVHFATNKMPLCGRKASYAIMFITKLADKPKGFWGKVKSIFKNSFEAICVKSYGRNDLEAARNMEREIKDISSSTFEKFKIKSARTYKSFWDVTKYPQKFLRKTPIWGYRFCRFFSTKKLVEIDEFRIAFTLFADF